MIVSSKFQASFQRKGYEITALFGIFSETNINLS